MPLLINGQPFIPPEGLEINPSNPYSSTQLSGGIKVQWNPNDVENLSGSSWDQTSGTGWVEIERVTSHGILRCSSGGVTRGDTFGSVQTRRWRAYFYNPLTGAYLGTSPTGRNGTSWYILHAVPNRFKTPACGGGSGDGWNSVVYALNPTSLLGSYYFDNSSPLPVAVAIMAEYPTWVKVASNTGAYSLRETTTPPAISLFGNCGLQINYSNGSKSPLMEFPVCPTVEIVPDCPCPCPSTFSLADSVINFIGTF